VIFCYSLILGSLYFGLAYLAYNSVSNYDDDSYIDTEIQDEIIRDWITPGYIDMVVVSNLTECPSDYDQLVFTRDWMGTRLGCDCDSI